MNKKGKFLVIFGTIILLLASIGSNAVNKGSTFGFEKSPMENPINSNENVMVEPAPSSSLIDENSESKPIVSVGPIETLTPLGYTWSNPPGTWWDTDWEYRIKINVTSPTSYDLENWPIEIRVTFNPPAYKYSIRVVNQANEEIPSQLSFVDYIPGDNQYISSANVSFLVTQTAGATVSYWIYWRTDYTDPPLYAKSLKVDVIYTSTDTIYRITSVDGGWSIDLPGAGGAMPTNLMIGDSESLGQSGHNHFGNTLNATTDYYSYWGTANTTVNYASRYIPGIDDPLINGYYLGVVYVPYIIVNSALVDNSNNIIGYANYTYKFYNFGVNVRESVRFTNNRYVTNIYTQGWVFDQDDGASDYNFDKIYTPTGITDISAPRYNVLSGSLIRYFNGPTGTKRIYDTTNNRPGIAILRVYLTAGTHYVKIVPAGDAESLGPDDWAARIALPNGTWLSFGAIVGGGMSQVYNGYNVYGVGDDGYLLYSYGPWVNVTVNAPVSGYYFITLEDFDDDNNDNDNTGMTASIYIDNNIVLAASVASYWSNKIAYNKEDPTDDGYVFYRDSIQLLNLEIPSEAVNYEYNITMTWSASDDLDIMVLKGDSSVMGYNVSDVPYKADLYFTPTSAGNYTVVVHKFSGAIATVPFNIDIQVKAGPEYTDFEVTGYFNWFALYHGSRSLGVGLVKISENVNVPYSAVQYLIYNEGNDSDDDYIYWAKEYIVNGNIGPSNYIKNDYYVIIWQPNGTTDTERTSDFNYYVQRLNNQPTISVNTTVEKFHLALTVKVVDGNNVPVPNAYVELYNGTSLMYNGTTDYNGELLLSVYRIDYNVKVYVRTLNDTEVTSTIAQYSVLHYSIQANILTVQFSSLVRFVLYAESNTTTPYSVQNGEVLLINSANASYKLYGKTNLTGWLVAFIPIGNWILKFNSSPNTATPDDWDYFYLFNDSSKTSLIGTGAPYQQVEITLTLTSDKDYYLVDNNLQSSKIETELLLYNTPNSFTAYWTENITIQLYFVEKNNNSRKVDGTIYWYVFDSDNNKRLSGNGTTDNGYYSFKFNTSSLEAGYTYTILINATPKYDAIYQSPTPLSLPLTVKKRITTVSLSLLPAQVIYWDETIRFEATYIDSIRGNVIPDANVNITISSGTFNQTYQLTFTGTKYVLTINSFTYPAGTYTVRLFATKDNYQDAEIVTQLIVNLVPTDAEYPSSITISWQPSYEIAIKYFDTRDGTPIGGANATLRLLYASNSTEITRLTLNFNGTHYVNYIQIDTLGLKIGSYIMEITINKVNYESKTITIPFNINLRKTIASADNTRLTLTYGDQVTVRVEYYDVEEPTAEPITTGTGTYIVSSLTGEETLLQGTLTSLGNGTYLLQFSTTQLGLGSYTIIITLNANHYETRTIYIYLTINPIPTIGITSTSNVTMYWNETINIQFTYLRSDNNTGVSKANVTYYIKDFKTNQKLTGDITLITNDDGAVTISFHADETFTPGSYILVIEAYKANYTSVSTTVYINVKLIPTSASVDKSTLNLEWGDNIELKFTYNRTIVFTGGIDNADNHTFVIYKAGNIVLKGTLSDVGNGYYSLNLNTSKIGLGSFLVYAFFEEAYHQNQTIIVTVDVSRISTYAYTDYDSINLIWGYSQNLTVYYNRTSTGNGVSGADLSVTLINASNGRTVRILSWFETVGGVYIVPINTSTISPGSYIINVTLSKANYTGQELIVTLTVTKVPTIAIVSTSNVTIYWNDSTTITFTYLRTDTGEGVPGATVIYYYTYFENGSTIGKTIIELTNDNGNIVITFYANKTFVPGAYVLEIQATKENFIPIQATVSINVLKRPMSVSLSLDNLSLIWGDKTNITMLIKDSITGEGLPLDSNGITLSTNINNSITITAGGKGIYYIVIDTTKLNGSISSTPVLIYITKPYYVSKSTSFTIKVDPVVIEARLAGQQTVTLNPISGGTTTYKAGLFDKSRGGLPITTASINLVVSAGGENTYSITMQSIEGEPGYYQATVNWANLPIFKPGETYSISIQIANVEINGISIPQEMIGRVVNVEAKSIATTVDYLGGSTDLPGLGRVPALIAYPIIIVALVVGSIIGYKVVSYMMLPPEVKEVDKLIKLIEKDVFEYEAESRDETIRKLSEKELG